MAVLDPTTNEVVIRVVYDGPPEAGKTTSVRALATSFRQATETPEESSAGRTQWFDWMEYVGGRFEGSQIRCQIISVPGQRELGHRRVALLGSADVIVFVGDSTSERFDVSLEYLDELRALRDTSLATVGIVFQANKRDRPSAIAMPEIRRQIGEARWEVGIVESIATDGTGIREAFVYAVRLALDRVRELLAAGNLREGRPDQISPAELLARLRMEEITEELPAVKPASLEESVLEAIDTVVVEEPQIATSADSVAATLIQQILASEYIPVLPPIPALPKVSSATPRPPDASVPSGAIWPPVEGRAILLEVAGIELSPRRHTDGDWSAGLGSGWRLVSKRDAVFDSLDAGRTALVQWARLHTACMRVVSPHRCIVLAAAGDGTWRLWQIVRAEESLREMVERTSGPADVVIDSLCQTAQLLLQVNEKLAEAPCELPCSLDTVGACDASGMYIGLMPEASIEPTRPRLSSSALLMSELGPVLQLDLADMRGDLGRALQSKASVHEDGILASLRTMLTS